LKRWINFKKVFPVSLFDDRVDEEKIDFVKGMWFDRSGVKGMPQMLSLCGLKLKGRHHSGIDDATNIARCVIRCLERGFVFH